jgi:phage shock protein A
MELSKRIDNILGPWPTPDQVREALLLLARHMAVQAEVAEHRRHVATVMQREDALKKRVEELERERDDAKEQATSLASLARASKALAAKRAETIAAQQQHIEVLNRRLAERDADSETTRWCRHE